MRGFAAAAVLLLVPALPAPAAAQDAVALKPLTQTEISEGIERGLGCDFRVGDASYLVVVIGEALINPGSGVHHFRIAEDHSLAIINDGGNFGDSSFRVLVDRDDAILATAEETVTRKARLTVRSGGAEQTLTGTWNCGA